MDHTKEEVFCTLACPDQLVEDTKQEVSNILPRTVSLYIALNEAFKENK